MTTPREQHERRLRDGLLAEGLDETAARRFAERLAAPADSGLFTFAIAYRATGLSADAVARVIAGAS